MKEDTSKETILVIATGMLVLHFLFGWSWAVPAATALGLIGVFSTFLSRKIEWAWMKLSVVLGHIVPNVILGLVFFLILTPISMLYRFMNKDPLMLSGRYDSHFLDVSKEVERDSFEKVW